MTELNLGRVRQISRAVSQVENRAPGHETLLREAYANPDWATVVGITGPPGAGKSTLVDALAAHWARDGEPVAVLAIDPSSPFSGGAVLGDRIRMDRSQGLKNVFFRSLSARGHVGGASAATCDLIALLGHFGFRKILLETVGAGQSDIEVTGLVDCTVVVAVPGLGDTVQALKAGIMEIADVYAINKSDLPGATATLRQIESTLTLAYPGKPGVGGRVAGHPPSPTAGVRALMRRHGDPYSEDAVWHPPVLPVSASKAEGIEALTDTIDAFLAWSVDAGRFGWKRKIRIRDQILRGVTERLLEAYRIAADDDDAIPQVLKAPIARVLAGETAPGDAVAELLSAPRGSTGADTEAG